MGNGPPDAVGLVVDAENTHGDPGTSGRTAALGVAAQAVDAAVQRNEDAGGIHHTDRADVLVSDRIHSQRAFVGIGARLLD